VLARRHVPWEVNAAIACAGVTVTPGDLIVGDGDGVIVIPAHLAMEVARDAAEQELQEEFAAAMVAKGESVDGLYPLGKRWQVAYEAWLAGREGLAGREEQAHEVP
jgi:5-oxopent-3-ene-1,2,5-tricarboxylate decarboxylase/2-hydroxyhepta-2,4-diene-1,7-dioate isomerase